MSCAWRCPLRGAWGDAASRVLLALGLVFSWGDGDFGKLGRGGSEGCNVPQNIERLNGQGVCQIECGAQFSLALTKSGVVWTWCVDPSVWAVQAVGQPRARQGPFLPAPAPRASRPFELRLTKV